MPIYLVHWESLLAGACVKQAKTCGLNSASRLSKTSSKTRAVEASKEFQKGEEALLSNSQNKQLQDPTARISSRTRSQVKALLESDDQVGVKQVSSQLQKPPSSISCRTRSQLKHWLVEFSLLTSYCISICCMTLCVYHYGVKIVAYKFCGQNVLVREVRMRNVDGRGSNRLR